MEVLTAFRPIVGTDWHLVAKLDYAEMMAPLWKLVWWIGLISLAAIAAIGLVLRLLWRQQEKRQDLVARAREAQILRESEILLRTAQEISHIGHFKYDPVNRAIEASDELLRIFGLSSARVQFSDFAVALHPDERDRVARTIRQAEKQGSGYSIETRLLLPDGSVKDVRMSRRAPVGDEIWRTGTVQDISEHRQQQEQSRLLLEENQTILNNALVGIVHLRQQRIVSYNRRFEEIFLYEPDEPIGESIERLYDTPENFLAIGARVYPILAEARNCSEEVMLRHKDGKPVLGCLQRLRHRPSASRRWQHLDLCRYFRAPARRAGVRQAAAGRRTKPGVDRHHQPRRRDRVRQPELHPDYRLIRWRRRSAIPRAS